VGIIFLDTGGFAVPDFGSDISHAGLINKRTFPFEMCGKNASNPKKQLP
jgi:hypothetical protein